MAVHHDRCSSIFPGEGSVEPETEPTSKLEDRRREEEIQQLKRTVRIERVTQILLVIRDRRARDDQAASLRENDSLRDELRCKRGRNRRKEQFRKSYLALGCCCERMASAWSLDFANSLGRAFCVLVGLFEAMKRL